MGMGYAANKVDVVDYSTVSGYCPTEFKAFLESIGTFGGENDLAYFARELSYSDCESPEIQEAYDKLCEAFKAATGLVLYIGFHGSDDDGDRYDEVDGVYWGLDNVWQRTPAAEKIKGKIQSLGFVTLG